MTRDEAINNQFDVQKNQSMAGHLELKFSEQNFANFSHYSHWIQKLVIS